MGTDPGKPIIWMVDSKKILSGFPKDVRYEIGHSLRIAQLGSKDASAKPLFSGVLEVVADSEIGNTYRAAYIAKLEDYVYVLHCFEKKAKHGIATPKSQLDLIRKRLKAAREHNAKHIRESASQKT
jgi:phage-related protein